MTLSQKHLTGIGNLSTDDILALLDKTRFYAELLEAGKDIPQVLARKIVLTLFFENSTRTRTSFDIAANRLGAQVVHWNPETSSLKKNESFLDTVMTLGAMKPDAVVIRHSEYGAPEVVARHVSCPVINAGDSWREHPTQDLLDAFTIQQAKGRIEGLTVAIIGDIAHSRVASSNIILLTRLGAKVHVIAPPVLMPEKLPGEGVSRFTSPEQGLPGADIVMTLRLQKERMQSALIASDQVYFKDFGLTAERLALANPGALVMDPGPFIRDVQIAGEVADDPARSLILRQVFNGVPARMAVLDLLLR